jgi:hypothetical protein
MSTIHPANALSASMSKEERQEVRDQLNRLLEAHPFKNSRRYPALLRFMVEETLEGRGEFLKERLLGIRVFDRPADYDTAADPVVRVTIAEIRKRIAQYYHEEEHDSELRIELLPGHYVPIFLPRRTKRQLYAQPSVSDTAQPQADSAQTTPNFSLSPDLPLDVQPNAWKSSRVGWYLAAPVLLLAALSVLLYDRLAPSAIDQLWGPLIQPRHEVLVIIPTDVEKKRGPMGEIIAPSPNSAAQPAVSPANETASQTFLAHEALGENVVYSDMLATLRIARLLATRQTETSARLNGSVTFADLRNGPSVMIGGLDNPWTMRALHPLRFHFAGNDEIGVWIADAQHPDDKSRLLLSTQQYAAVTHDYAIVARLHNDETGQPEMIVAGIGMSGTAAAGEFITDQRRVDELKKRIGSSFKDRDFEAVLSTDVVNGIAGSPKILDVTVF